VRLDRSRRTDLGEGLAYAFSPIEHSAAAVRLDAGVAGKDRLSRVVTYHETHDGIPCRNSAATRRLSESHPRLFSVPTPPAQAPNRAFGPPGWPNVPSPSRGRQNG